MRAWLMTCSPMPIRREVESVDVLPLGGAVEQGGWGMGSFYRSRHELVFVFKHGRAVHRNNIQLGQFGRNRTNV